MNIRQKIKQRGYPGKGKKVYRGKFRLSAKRLAEICKKGEELLLNTTPNEITEFRKWN